MLKSCKYDIISPSLRNLREVAHRLLPEFVAAVPVDSFQDTISLHPFLLRVIGLIHHVLVDA
jgi:hypothetical protein